MERFDDSEHDQPRKGLETITRRTVSAALEDIVGVRIAVLDKGFIRLVDYMGDEGAIVQAARISYGKGTKSTSQDAALLRYLLRNGHTTPFEMCEIKLHVKLPVFVARQWVRHRTASINEQSARYSVVPNEYYIPDASSLAEQSKINKQGRTEDALFVEDAEMVRQMLNSGAKRSFEDYETLLNADSSGDRIDPARPQLARELARIGLPLSAYTEWYWKVDLHNLLNFLRLRMDAHAQYEIRMYAQAIGDVVRQWVPVVYQAFEDHMLKATRLSNEAALVLRKWIAGDMVNRRDTSLSQSEWDELVKRFK